ncbi:MAG: UDP-N-acetylmuramate--L-alanine ligase, partial [Clostridia bacterium]|nr:UDP-N-acetylmuramate--L-alanine ligase [Clostridia bacterium]
AKALSEFDETIIAEIYAAREENVFGVTSEMLAQRVKNGRYVSDLEKIAEHLKSLSSPDTLIITLGAGRMDTVAKKITK